MSDGPVGVIFEVSEESVCNGVDFEFQRLLRWREPVVTPEGVRVAVPREGRGIEDQTIDLLEPKAQLIKGVRGESVGAYGEQTITYKVPGQVWYTTDDGVTLQEIPGGLAQFVQDAGDVIVDRRGWGAKVSEIEVFDEVAGEPGDYVDLNLPHQVNERTDQTPKAQRGGTRKVQITGRTPKPGTAVLQLEDAGNLAQTMPEPEDPVDDATLPVPEFTLAASDDAPLTIATATVTNDTDLEDFGAVVEWAYEVSDTEPVDDGTAFGPLALGFGVDTIDVPAVPSGSTVWVRARALVQSTSLRSDWSAWTSITLGPDDDGTGGTLPPFDLDLAIDSDGVLSATASSLVAAITKVYFVAGPDDGTAPSYADVLAGTADASGPPFTAGSLATMAVGETRTVGAIGEDALGNRTTLVLATKTRLSSDDVDPGTGAGTPGNFRLTLHAGPPRVFRNIGAALSEPLGMKGWRKSENTGAAKKARIQHNCHSSSGGDLELHLTYSLDKFATAPIETGVFVRADRPQFPEVGEYLLIDEAALGDNVTLGCATKGGDGDSVLKTENVYVDVVSSETTPEPPSDTDLPQGGPLGTLKLILDARELIGTTDLTRLTEWLDISGFDNHAEIFDAVAQGGIFYEDAFGDGKPSMGFNPSGPLAVSAPAGDGLAFPIPAIQGFTYYVVGGKFQGLGSDGKCFANASILNNHAGSSQPDFAITMRTDGKIVFGVGENAVVSTNASHTTGAAYDGTRKDVHTFIRQPAGGSYGLYVNASSEGGNSGVTGADLTAAPYVGLAYAGGGGFIKGWYHMVLCYDAVHDATQIATVKAALRTIWGTT